MTKISRYSSVILLGIWSIITQIVLIREFLVVLYGNELIVGVILANWLIGVNLGALSAGILSKRFNGSTALTIDPERSRRVNNDIAIFIRSQVIALTVLPIAIYLIRNMRNIIGIPAGLMIPFMPTAVFSFLIVVPVAFLAGFCFPVAARIFNNIGKAYILEGVGAFLGGIVFSFFLAGRIDHYTVIFSLFIIVTLNLALPVCKPNRFLYFIVLCLTVLLASGAARRLDTLTSKMRLKSINSRMELLGYLDSKYQNITIAKQQGQINVLGDGRFMYSFPEEYNNEIFINIVMNQHPNPRRILLIGPGIAGEIYQILKYPIERLDYVELDPQLIRLVGPYLTEQDNDALKDKRLSVFFSDGRLFVSRTQSKYDLVIVNITDASTAVLNRFYTREFFHKIRPILKDSGVFTVGITSALNYLGPDIEKYAGSIYKTLRAVFPYVIVMPGDRNQFFCSLSKDITTTDTDILEKRFLEKKIQNRYFRSEVFKNIFFPERVKSLEESLVKSQAPINTDIRPISYYYNLILWNLFSGSNQASVFRKLERLDLFEISLFGLGALLILRLIFIILNLALRKRSPENHILKMQKFNACWVIFTVGFAAMAFEMILIFSFQNTFGNIYEMIGLIIGIFMLGMILAAAFSNSILMRFQRGLHLALLVNVVLVVIFALTLPFGKTFPIPLIFVAGILTGAAFPLACGIYIGTEMPIGLTAGVIDSADVLGASIGVLLTGTLLVPLLGMTKTCILIAGLNLTSVALICFGLAMKKSVLRLN